MVSRKFFYSLVLVSSFSSLTALAQQPRPGEITAPTRPTEVVRPGVSNPSVRRGATPETRNRANPRPGEVATRPGTSTTPVTARPGQSPAPTGQAGAFDIRQGAGAEERRTLTPDEAVQSLSADARSAVQAVPSEQQSYVRRVAYEVVNSFGTEQAQLASNLTEAAALWVTRFPSASARPLGPGLESCVPAFRAEAKANLSRILYGLRSDLLQGSTTLASLVNTRAPEIARDVLNKESPRAARQALCRMYQQPCQVLGAAFAPTCSTP